MPVPCCFKDELAPKSQFEFFSLLFTLLVGDDPADREQKALDFKELPDLLLGRAAALIPASRAG